MAAAKQTPQQRRALEAAEAYAARGWAPIPLRGKRPLRKGWPETSAASWQANWVEGVENVGLCTGQPGGFVAVDVDVKDRGLELWAELVAAHGAPETVTVRTGGGGFHFYFAADERTLSLIKTIKCLRHADGSPAGIDLISGGGQVVAPPSFHDRTKRPYTFIRPPEDFPVLPPMPDWLFDLISKSLES